MVKFVDQQLTQLRNEVYRMWAMVYSQMDQARQAVLGMDRKYSPADMGARALSGCTGQSR